MHLLRHLKFLVIVMLAAGISGCGFEKAAVRKNHSEKTITLGEAYMGEGRYTNALREFLKAYRENPDDPFLNNDLGLAYLAKGDAEKAVFHFKRAIELKPGYSPAKNNLGSAYIALKQWDKAIECFNSAKNDLLYATPYFPLSNLGYVYYMKKDYGRAEKYYNEALDLQPNFPKALDGLGQVYTAMGRYKDAIRVLKRAAAKAPKVAPIYMNLAKAYAGDHQYYNAINAYKKVAAMAAGTALGEEAEAAIERLKWMR